MANRLPDSWSNRDEWNLGMDVERAVLAGILNDYVCVQFPEYAKSHSGAGVLGVPGFWQERSGVVRIWKRRKDVMPLLVIPYKDENGFI